MHIVPVIDIRHGLAVRGVQGDRANYAPLVTPLAASSDPLAVAEGLLGLFPFDTFYVADLDGIEGRGGNAMLSDRLHARFPDLTLWLDAGAETAADRMTPVIGSESLASLADYERCRDETGGAFVLSLDFRDDIFVGPPQLLDDADFWPERVIVMTLARVGSGSGPDLARLVAVARRAGGRRVYAAGGIRDRQDLLTARNAGAAGALVATALHEGTLGPEDLRASAYA